MSQPTLFAGLPVRWIKLVRDLQAEKGRVALMLLAIAVSIAAIGAVLGAYSVLTREIASNYLETHPADATLELEGGVDAETLALVRHHPLLQDAEARDVLPARVKVGEDWRPLLLFAVDDFRTMRLNTFKPVSGMWPPAPGSIAIERAGASLLETELGGKLAVKTAHGPTTLLPITAIVHDPGLAPAWQERTGYGYISRDTLPALGEAPLLHELRIAVRAPAGEIKTVEAVAADLAQQLTKRGITVHQIRIPPPSQHPHQRQMTTMLFLMLAFSLMALVLSSILVANSLAAMLARQVREIAVMKTVGARTHQIIGIYVTLVMALGTTAIALAIPLGVVGADTLANAVAGLLNFNINDAAIPAWVFLVQACAGSLVPLLMAALPIAGASRKSVRVAIDQHGVGTERLRQRTAKLPRAVRNALRRPGRLALTVALLSAGGAMFMTALNVSSSWDRNIAKVYETRHYDVEVHFHEPQPMSVAGILRQLPEVASVEAWGYSPAALARPGQIDLVRTYPDRGHGSLVVMAPPADTQLVQFPLRAGRWLKEDDSDAVVLNHAIAAQIPQATVGTHIDLSIDGTVARWQVVGIVEEIGSAGAAYVGDRAFQKTMNTPGRERMLRIATRASSPQGRVEAIRVIEQRLSKSGIDVETAIPLAELRTAMADHIVILIRSLIAMAAVMATVGALGLASTMGTTVTERTREFAVMKTIGATPNQILRLVTAESLFIALLSWFGALILALPLTLLVDTLVGNLGFVAPLPFVIAPRPALGWFALVGVVALASTAVPAYRASRLSVARAITQL